MQSPTESNATSAFDLQLEDGGTVYAESFAESVRPPALVDIDTWADENRILSGKASSEPGPWRTDRVPFAREIMKELSVSSSTTEIVFKKATQIVGTEIILNWAGYVIDYAPAAMMIVWPTSNTGKRNSKQRLSPLIDETPVLKRKVVPARSRESGNTTLMKEFAGGVLVVAGANSAAELKSMPIKFLAEDEVDEYPDDLDGQGDPGKLAEKRTTNFPRRKIYKCSSPTVKGFSKIDDAYEASDQRRYNVPCPSCHQKQVLVWDQMRWTLKKVLEFVCYECGQTSDGDLVDGDKHICPVCQVETVIEDRNLQERETDELISVFYECVHCQFEIAEYHKTEMLAGGEWIAERPGPDRAAGFHINALYAPLGWYSWREAVKDYIEALVNETLMKVFQNTVLAESYVDKTAERPEVEDVKGMAEAYRIGVVPEGGLMLIASVDVQGNRLEVKLKAWGRGEESWLIDYHVIHGDPDDDSVWSALEEFINKKIPHVGGGELPIVAVGIDSGYKTQRVYNFCRNSKHRHVIPLKGMPNDGRAILGTPNKQDIDYRGERIKQGIKLWTVGTYAAKSQIYGRLKPNVDKETGEILERADRMHFPIGLPDEYYDQLTAESLITLVNKKTGKARREWRKKASDKNEALDLEVYNIATSIYAGIKRVDWDKLEKRLNLKQSDLFNENRDKQQSKPASNDQDDRPVDTPTPAGNKRRANTGRRVRNPGMS